MALLLAIIVIGILFYPTVAGSGVIEIQVEHKLLEEEQTVTEVVTEFEDIPTLILEQLPPIMLEVARCESGLKQFNEDGTVLRGVVNPQDIGIMQINTFYHLEESIRLGYDIYTTKGNIGYAKHLYDTQGTQPWYLSEHCWGN